MISQEVFDEMVLENIEEFELTKEESLLETIKQLKSMGRDLSLIDITGGEIRNQIINYIKQLKEYNNNLNNNLNNNFQEIIRSLQDLLFNNNNNNNNLSNNNNTYQNIFRINGGIIILLSIINMNEYSKENIQLGIEFLINLSKNNVETRDLFEPGGAEKVCRVIQESLLTENLQQQQETLSLLKTCFRCVKVMSKSENNKVGFVNQNIHQLIFQFLTHETSITSSSSLSSNPIYTEILKEICLTIKTLCTHDDQRKEMSCAYDNSKKFLSDGIIPYLIRYSQHYELNPDLAACSLSALRQLILSEEAVKIACSNGIMTLPKQILMSQNSTIPLIRAVVGLIRNLCADDNLKNTLVSDNILPLLVYYMNREEYQSDYNIMEHILATLAAIALRYPNNATSIVNSGAIDEIVSIMRRFYNRPVILRQACLTIRNIASRSPELRKKILDYGIETLLREAGKYQDCVDEAYAALRDLECNVQYVKIKPINDNQSNDNISTNSTIIETAYEQFGITKPKFNPVFEESYDIMNRIEDKATAPFASTESNTSKSIFRIDEDDDNDGNDDNDANYNNGQNYEHKHTENCCH